MFIGAAEIKLYIPWAHSLKEKRTVVKSLIAKVHNKFNASIAETGEQDVHQIAEIGICCVTNNTVQAWQMIDNMLNYIESITEAEVIHIFKEIK